MKKVFLITRDDRLDEAFGRSANQLGASVETSRTWSDAKDALFKDRYDAVFIDYDAVKVEGLDSFILLDNILQKEDTPGALVLQQASRRTKQFTSSLGSFRDAIELGDDPPTPARLSAHLQEMLDGAAPASSIADQSWGTDQLDVEVHLPSLEGGSLSAVDLPRVLYTLAQERTSGILALQNASIKRRYAIIDGQPVANPGAKFSTLETLASAFAWQDGHYEFHSRTVASTRSLETREPFKFIYHSMQRHLPQRRIMQAMMTRMNEYPTVTNLWERRAHNLAWADILQTLAGLCDGATTLETALAQLGADATAGFEAALFAYHTDLIILRNQPTSRPVNVQYDARVRQAQQQRAEEEKKATTAYRAAGTGRIDLENELRNYLDELQQASPYKIFDVWKGCGRKEVQQKFYQMVKQHHPDAYGGNVSGDVKSLAQEIFITIKDAYTALLKAEGDQLRADPRVSDHEGASPANADAGNDSETITGAGQSPRSSADLSTDRLRAQTPAGRASMPEGKNFGAQPAQSSNDASDRFADAARQTRIERLKAKRRATPIGLSRKPSSPIIGGKSRTSNVESTSEGNRGQKIDKIRRNSQAGAQNRSTTGARDAASDAEKAFNQGYRAFRKNENETLAYQRFSTAHRLEPDNAKYMTFFGYLMFLTAADQVTEAKKLLQKAIDKRDRQSLPDAHVFLGHILKVQDHHKQAVRHFKKALQLNPKSRQAQRELRLYQRRNEHDDGSNFLKDLFDK